MKKTTRFLLICASLASLALPAFANGVFSPADQTPEPCSVDGKVALYGELYKELKDPKGDQAKVHELAKKYVACPAETGEQTPEQKDAEAKRIAFLQNFMAKWEKAHRKDLLTEAINKKDYAGAFELGKQVFVDDPAYLKGYLNLANAGYAASLVPNSNGALNPDTVEYAKKSLQLIESGQSPEKGDPFQSKEDALGWLNYFIAFMTKDKSPAESIPYFIKAASYDNTIKKLPSTYNFLGVAYEAGPYAKQSAAYKIYEGKDESAEQKLAFENINQVVDRMIDAYARAVALAGSDPKYAAIKGEALASATTWYKFRHKDSDVGLTDLIAGILSKPLPPEPTPLTSLPTSAATPTPTPTPRSGTPATTGSSTPAPVKPTTPPSTTRATSPTRP